MLQAAIERNSDGNLERRKLILKKFPDKETGIGTGQGVSVSTEHYQRGRGLKFQATLSGQGSGHIIVRGVSSKGRIVQGTHSPRDGTSEDISFVDKSEGGGDDIQVAL